MTKKRVKPKALSPLAKLLMHAALTAALPVIVHQAEKKINGLKQDAKDDDIEFTPYEEVKS